jgi:hypothetical protein
MFFFLIIFFKNFIYLLPILEKEEFEEEKKIKKLI